MKLSINMKGKFLTAFGLILLMLIILIGMTYINTSSIISIQREISEKYFIEIIDMLELKADQNRTRALMLEMTLTKNRKIQQEIEHKIKTKAKKIDERLKKLYKFNKRNSEQIDRLKELEREIIVYRQKREQLVLLVYQGKTQEVIAAEKGIQTERYNKIRDIILDFTNLTITDVKKHTKSSLEKSNYYLMFILILGCIIMIVCLLIFRIIIKSLRSVTGDISDGINVLGTSASEIVTMTSQVAASASETATSITETTTTVEEVRQTAQLSSEKARVVQETAQKTTQAVEKGKQSVAQTIQGMERIHQQMNSISSIVVNLSEQSQTIGEITSTVNDIADQSNLLAVNASIEAVKAGEQGLGFSVVAQEIKSLAEQSKQATAQVRLILNDIQKAVNQAVMATEQGIKAVEEGGSLAEQSGETIELLYESVNEAARAATQIAASNQQQLAGMDQIAPSMENVKQAMAQNAASTGQAQNAAQNLHDLGVKLKELVEKFKV